MPFQIPRSQVPYKSLIVEEGKHDFEKSKQQINEEEKMELKGSDY